MFELIALGIIVGSMSGFFGIGGGTILVPMLLLLGFETKVAIGISVVQMVFGSLYGSYLNNKKGTLDLVMISTIGLGGFIGALLSGPIAFMFSSDTLEMLFLSFTIFALVRLFVNKEKNIEVKTIDNKFVLLLIGFFIGSISMTIGVGGSLILVPVLVGYLHVPILKATSAGLFFVVFSSIAGLISHSYHGHIDYESGLTIGVASLFGVYIGIHLKHIVKASWQKRLLIFFYIMIVIYLTYRIFGV